MTLHRSDEAGRDLNAGERSQEAPPPRTAAFQNHRIHAAFQKTILAQHALSTSRHGKSTITLSEQFHFIANRSLPVLLFSNSDRKLRIGHFQLPIHGVGIENGLAQRYTDRASRHQRASQTAIFSTEIMAHALNFSRDFWISVEISGFQLGFLDFSWDFWISVRISGFQMDFKWISGFHMDFRISGWISGFRAGFL